MKTLKNLLCGATLLASAFVATSAFAAPLTVPDAPDPTMTGGFECEAGTAHTQYDRGFFLGYTRIYAVWEGSGMGRADAEDFIRNASTMVAAQIGGLISTLDDTDPMENPMGCRAFGNIRGTIDAVRDVLETLRISCKDNGALWAGFQAENYCELAQFGAYPTYGLLARNAAPAVCADAFQDECDDVFGQVTDTYVTRAPENRACSDLKVAAWQPGYDETQHNECTY